MRTNFFIVGGPKCGTTAWVAYLAAHADVTFSRQKEPHYFATDINGTQVASTLEKYEELFSHVTSESVVGDASVMHLFSREAADNICAYNPGAKILILLRDQFSFLKSYHNQAIYTGYESEPDLERAWELSDDRRAGRSLPARCTDAKMLDYPALAEFPSQVERYLNAFPPEQICVRWMDEWTSDARQFYTELMKFLQIEDDERADFEKIHGAHAHRSATIGELTSAPPGWMLQTAGVMKKLLGINRLGIASRLRKLNTIDVTVPDPSAEFEAMIRKRYESDRATIADLLKRHHVPWTAAAAASSSPEGSTVAPDR